MQKERVQQVLDSLPDDVDLDAFLEKLVLLQKIDAGERQIAAGQGVSHDDAKERLQQWLE